MSDGASDARQRGLAEAPVDRPAVRRQLTVLFSDLVGSTELAARMDPEDLGDLLQHYEVVVRTEVTRLGGSVVQVIGDGIVAGFGHPVANEDDAERAIRAGLAIIDAVAATPTEHGAKLRVRVAVATGSVVIGDPSGANPLGYDRIVGETPNLAARLQGLAQPQGLVIDGLTRRLAGRHFSYRSLGPQRLRGFEDPVPAFAVEGVQMVESRFAALRGTELGPLIGREPDVRRLKELWAQATTGAGRFASIIGEPGIGKSRLVMELIRAAEADGAQPLHYQCSAIRTNSPFYPIFERLQYAAGIRPEDTPDVRFAKLRAELLAGGPSQSEAADLLFAQILSQSSEQVQLPADQRKEVVLEALMKRLRDLAERKPLMIVVEDAHWADPSTLAVINRAFDLVHTLPVMVLVTARPEFEPTWPEPDAVLLLQALGRDDCRRMVEAIAGSRADPAVVDEIVTTTGGNPLFVEEVVAAFLGDDGRVDTDDSTRRTNLPRSLQGALNARLDRLGGAKRLAQFAAVIGRQFSDAMLQTLWPFEPEALTSSLDVLREDDVIRPVFARGDELAFKHVLVQEAAYRSLMRRERRRFHRLIGERLEERFSEFCAQHPDLLAAHFEAAALPRRAIEYRRQAAALATSRSAYAEATHHLRRIEALLDELDAGEERERLELECRLRLGTVLTATHGYADTVTAAEFQRAADLVASVGSPLERYMANLGLWRHAITLARMDDAGRFAGTMHAVATAVARPELALTAELAVGITAFSRGQPSTSASHLAVAVALYDPAVHDGLVHSHGQDPLGATLVWAGAAAWLTGQSGESRGFADRALRRARELDHPFTLTYTLHRVAVLHHLAGDDRAMAALVEELLTSDALTRFPYFAPLIRVHEGLLLSRNGEHATACRIGRDAAEQFENGPARFVAPYVFATLAEIGLAAGDRSLAETALTTAETAIAATGECWNLAEVLRLRALIGTALTSDHDQARVYLTQAIDTAEGQGALAYLVRALLDRLALAVDVSDRGALLRALGAAASRLPSAPEDNNQRMVRAVLGHR